MFNGCSLEKYCCCPIFFPESRFSGNPGYSKYSCYDEPEVMSRSQPFNPSAPTVDSMVCTQMTGS